MSTHHIHTLGMNNAPDIGPKIENLPPLERLPELEKRAKDTIIEVLVLSPDAEHITEELAKKLQHNSVEEIRERMRLALEHLKYLARRNGNFEVRCYNEKPNFKILMFDNVMFVTSFASDVPKNDDTAKMFRMVREGNPLFVGFERHFDELAKRSVSLS